ncbi:hypothetical protein J1N35_033905 [Gossypium stocksii]|uniref:Uncharacterized protein n=1 Tax=Gossypium stocksii TaxID=47602 RepID=A0A9D3ZQ19_9ROSI|nr:hypothetical protein J1N35_033905 [Gossypium stocksii]
MSMTKIPSLVFAEIEKLARGFLWGSTSSVQKPSLVSWEDCCKPQAYGGLVLEGAWNVHWLSAILPQLIVERILAHIPPSANAGTDHLSWRWLSRGKFSVSESVNSCLLITYQLVLSMMK